MRSDRGSATVWAAAMIAVLVSAGLALVAMAQSVGARQHASMVADLAALSGASAADPCRAARRAAEANRGRLVECAVLGIDVVVRVAVRAPVLASGLGNQPEVFAEARAGAPDSS
jgi:secretion/DNA translocation related TadE-like protein